MTEPATEIIEAVNNLRTLMMKHTRGHGEVHTIEVSPHAADFVMAELMRGGNSSVVNRDYRKAEKDRLYLCDVFNVELRVSKVPGKPLSYRSAKDVAHDRGYY